jgi:hypothetical protein
MLLHLIKRAAHFSFNICSIESISIKSLYSILIINWNLPGNLAMDMCGEQDWFYCSNSRSALRIWGMFEDVDMLPFLHDI